MNSFTLYSVRALLFYLGLIDKGDAVLFKSRDEFDR